MAIVRADRRTTDGARAATRVVAVVKAAGRRLFQIERGMRNGIRNLPLAMAIAGSGAAVALMIVLGSIVGIVNLRDEAIRSANREIANLTLLAAEQASQTVKSAEVLLRAEEETILALGATNADDLHRLAGTRAFHDQLVALKRPLTQIYAVGLIDPNGMAIANSRIWPQSLDLSDRDYFKQCKADPECDLLVSAPLTNLENGMPVLVMASRISAPDGTLLGIEATTVEVRYFERIFESIRLGAQGAAVIRSGRGRILARYPHWAQSTFDNAPMDDMPTEVDASGTAIRRYAMPDGSIRLVGSHDVTGVNMVVEVSEGWDSVLQRWRTQTVWIVTSGSIALLVTTALHLLLMRGAFAYRHQVREAETARATAEAAVQTRSRFLASMSHELRTPLNAIIGFSQTLEHGPPTLRVKSVEYAGYIGKSALHLNRLIEDLLDVGRIETDKLTLDESVFDIVALVDECIETMSLQAEARGHRIVKTGRAMRMPVFADYTRLKQAILNILSNAVKFIASPGVIEIAVESGEAGIVIAVSDTGPGMTSDELERLFEPYAQFSKDPLLRRAGAGLGMQLTMSFMDAHEGRVEVDSSIDRGTVVRLVLPAWRSQA